jgi:hypothetical protein
MTPAAPPTPPSADRLLAVLRALDREPLMDLAYAIREHEGRGDDGPRVAAWIGACVELRKIVIEAGEWPEPAARAREASHDVR